MPPSALISSAAMCSTLETVFSEIAMPPVRELRKPSLMVAPEASTQLAAGADPSAAVSSPAREPQPASTRTMDIPMAPVATSARSRLVMDIGENSDPGGRGRDAGSDSRLTARHCSDISALFQLCSWHPDSAWKPADTGGKGCQYSATSTARWH